MTCGLIAVLVAFPDMAPAADLTLCGLRASSATALYFSVAKRPDAKVLRADDFETILEVQETGTLWIFVAKPVSAVFCQQADPPLTHSSCDGSDDVCFDLVRRLTKDPRAYP